MPPASPFSFAQRTSSTARSMSCSRIWATPARRPGVAAQKSASQRLWAWSPAQRRSRSPDVAGGGWFSSEGAGKNGGIVLGKMTSPTMPSASSSASRRSLSQLRLAFSSRRSS
jgi:hypothetical protein